MAHEISETPLAFDWPDYQIPQPVLSALSASRPNPRPSSPSPLTPVQSTEGGSNHEQQSLWIIMMLLFILQLVVVGIVADVHIQQRNLMNMLFVGLAQKKYGIASISPTP
jgi:hypothetical protein